MTTLLTFVALNIGLMLAVMPAHAGGRPLTICPETVTAVLEITGIR